MDKIMKRNVLGTTILSYDGIDYIEFGGDMIGYDDDMRFVDGIPEVPVECMVDEHIRESLNMLGFWLDDVYNLYAFDRDGLLIEIESDIEIGAMSIYFENSDNEFGTIFADESNLIDSIIFIQDRFIEDEFEEIEESKDGILCSTFICAKQKINKNGRGRRRSTREMTQNLQRVKSSNIWSYGFELPEDSDFGQLFIQFKARNGGPGDLYQDANVPVNLWQKFIRTSSKGHFFWKYIRNNFLYRKLSGDKRGVLPNAVN